MNGMEAMKALKEGKVVATALDIECINHYRFNGDYIERSAFDGKGEWEPNGISAHMFLQPGRKWEIVHEYDMTFAEALVAMQEGKTVQCRAKKHSVRYIFYCTFMVKEYGCERPCSYFSDVEKQSKWRIVEDE